MPDTSQAKYKVAAQTGSTKYLAQLLPALLQLTQLGLQHLSTLAVTKKHAAATNFTPEQTKTCVWDRQSLIIDGWRRLDTKDAGRTLKECNRWFPKTGSRMTEKVRYVMYLPPVCIPSGCIFSPDQGRATATISSRSGCMDLSCHHQCTLSPMLLCCHFQHRGLGTYKMLGPH